MFAMDNSLHVHSGAELLLEKSKSFCYQYYFLSVCVPSLSVIYGQVDAYNLTAKHWPHLWWIKLDEEPTSIIVHLSCSVVFLYCCSFHALPLPRVCSEPVRSHKPFCEVFGRALSPGVTRVSEFEGGYTGPP